VAVVLGLIVTLAVRLLLGDAVRAGPAAAIAIFAMLDGDNRIVVLALIVLAIFAVERRVIPGRLHLPWPTINRVGRAMAVIVAIAILIQAAQLGSLSILARSVTAEGPLRPVRAFPPASGPADPDIYFILLDGYARSDALEQVFGIDPDFGGGALEMLIAGAVVVIVVGLVLARRRASPRDATIR